MFLFYFREERAYFECISDSKPPKTIDNDEIKIILK